MNENNYNITYKKSYGRNQMIIEPSTTNELHNYSDDFQNNFRVHMIKENTIDGFLQTHIQFMDGVPSFYYDISGLQSLRIVLESTPLSYELLCRILIGLYKALISAEKYMLIYEHILSELDYIYLSADYSDIYFCYYPMHMQDFGLSTRRLFDELLKAVDHNDEKCVYLAYSMHKESLNTDFNIHTLLQCLSTVPSETSYSKAISSPTYQDDHTYTYVAETPAVYTAAVKSTFDKDSTKFLAKIIILVLGGLLAIASITGMYFFGLYDFKFFLILLAVALVVIGYNGYMIYFLNAPSKLSSLLVSKMSNSDNAYDMNPPVADSTPRDESSTVLLTPISKDSIYRLVYVGTESRHDIELKTFPFIIGKNQTCDSYITDSTVSRIHAKIDQTKDAYGSETLILEDLNSTNGTLLNNVLLSPYEKTTISPGDQISFAGITYILR